MSAYCNMRQIKHLHWMYGLVFLVVALVTLNHVVLRPLYGTPSQPPFELSEEIQQCLMQFSSNGLTNDSLSPHVQMDITRMMEISLTDGYTMCVTCMAAVTWSNYSRYHVDMRWSGVGLLQSLWVNQLEAVTYRNCIAKKLCFSPWLDSHAGEYTCYLTVEGDSNFSVTMNKSITINGEFHGMINSRNTTQKFSTSPIKSNKWFPDTNLCGQHNTWREYTDFHSSVLSGKHKGKYLIYDCTNNDPKYECGGYGNRIHGITVLLILAMLTKRVFLLQMTKPVDINAYLLANAIQWNYALPEEFKTHDVDVFNKHNFYANYKPLEAALLGNDKYDAIKVRINFGLFYYLARMNDIMIEKTMSTFNLKTQYDVVMLYGCAFNYLFKYQPGVIQAIDSQQNELGLETGKFVALHVRSHIKDGSVFNPLHLKFPFQLMFKCATMVAKSLQDKLNMSKVPIYFTTDHPSIIEFAKQKYADVLVFSRALIFHVDHTTYSGRKANNLYNSGMIGVLSDIEICSRAAVLVRSADSTFSELMGSINFLRPEYNLHPFYFYEDLSLCRVHV